MSIFKQFFDSVRFWLTIAQTVDENQKQIDALSRDVQRLSEFVQNFAVEVRVALIEDRHEREKLELRLQNEQLKFERRLLPPSSSDEK